MDRIFSKDLRMRELQEIGPRVVCDILDWNFDEVTKPNEPRDVSRLATFLSMKVEMPIAMLLQRNLALCYDLYNWMNIQLDLMAKVLDGPSFCE